MNKMIVKESVSSKDKIFSAVAIHSYQPKTIFIVQLFPKKEARGLIDQNTLSS